MNAVASITPVPKCFPTKKSTPGIRIKEICFESDGKDTAAGQRSREYNKKKFGWQVEYMRT